MHCFSLHGVRLEKHAPVSKAMQYMYVLTLDIAGFCLAGFVGFLIALKIKQAVRYYQIAMTWRMIAQKAGGLPYSQVACALNI